MVGALNGIIGKSKQMEDLATLVRKVAPHDCSVLIRGESGIGRNS